MKTTKIHGTYPETLVYETEYGLFTKDRVAQSPSQSLYRMAKVSGEWPGDAELLEFCEPASGYFGGIVSKSEDTAALTCYTD